MSAGFTFEEARKLVAMGIKNGTIIPPSPKPKQAPAYIPMTTRKKGRRARKTRQYLWQLKQMDFGCCIICGKKAVTKHHCEKHRRIASGGCDPWKPGGRGRPPLKPIVLEQKGGAA